MFKKVLTKFKKILTPIGYLILNGLGATKIVVLNLIQNPDGYIKSMGFRIKSGMITYTNTIKQDKKRALPLLIGLLLILIPSVYLTTKDPAPVEAGWWNDNWGFRKKFVVTNDGSGQTDYPMHFALGPISEGRIREDCGDIRITDINGQLLSDTYWVDCLEYSNPTVWVEFASVPVGSTVIYMYYGNTSAESLATSAATDIFAYAYTFDGAVIDTALIDYGGGTLTQDDYLSIVNTPFDQWDNYAYTDLTFARAADYTLYGKFKADSGAKAAIGWHDSTTGNGLDDFIYAIYFNNGNFDVYEDNNSRAPGGTYTVGNWYDIKIVQKATGAKYYTKPTSSNTWSELYDSSYSSETPLRPGIAHNDINEYSHSDSWILLQQAATEPTSTASAEEQGPGPIAHWKFDESHTQEASFLSKHEQQINILNKEYANISSSFVPDDNSLGIVRWDADKYPGADVYFEAVFKGADCSGTPVYYVALYDTDGNVVQGSTVSRVCGTTYDRIRSGGIDLTDDTDYTIRIRNNKGDRNTTINSARLIVRQTDDSKLKKTQTQIEIGNPEYQSSSTETWLADRKIYYYDSSQFDPTPTAYYEASLINSPPTIEQQINIVDQLYQDTSNTYSPTDDSLGIVHWDASEYTGATVYFEALIKGADCSGTPYYYAALFTTGPSGSQVSNSEVSVLCSNTAYSRLRSNAITLTDDTDYTVRIKNNKGDRNTSLKAARLIVQQTDNTSITNTETQVEVGNNESTTEPTLTVLQNQKIYQYDDDLFSGSVEAFFEATLVAGTSAGSSSSTSATYPGTIATYADTTNGYDDNDWTNASNVNDNDGNNAEIVSPTFDAVDFSYVIRARDFGFSGIAGSASIAGVEVIAERYYANGTVADALVQLSYNSAGDETDRLGVNKSAGAAWPSSAGTAPFGSSDDLWGATLNPSTIQSANFGVDIAADATGDNADAFIDYVTMKVWYEEDGSQESVYAALYNITNSTTVGNSTISSATNVWGLVRSGALTSDWDTTNDDQYEVRWYTSDSSAPAQLANAKIILSQSDPSGLTALETVQQLVNSPITDTDNTYTDQEMQNQYNYHLEVDENSFAGGTLTYIYESTMFTDAGTAYSLLKNDTNGTTIPNSELTTASTSATRVTSGDLAAGMPKYPQNTTKDFDTQARNSAASGNTTTINSSWLKVRVSNLATSGVTAYSDLYNITDSATVPGSQVSATDPTWKLIRSSPITLTTDKEYAVRLWSSVNGAEVLINNAKLILDQEDTTNGIKSTETMRQMINTTVTDSDTGYTDQDYFYEYDPEYDPWYDYYFNNASLYFEATMKTDTGGGSDDAYAILKDDDGASTITNSEIITSNTDPTRVRSSSSIPNNMPSSTTDMDTQIRNESTSTTTATNSWVVVQSKNTIPSAVQDTSGNMNHGNLNGATWKVGEGCPAGNCFEFDGTNDFLIMRDDPSLDFIGSDDFTITGWFRHPSSAAATEVIVSKYETTGSDGGYKVYMNSSGQIVAGIDDNNAGFPLDSVTTDESYNDNGWHHFAMLKDGATSLKLYMDGVLKGTDGTISSGTLSNNDNFYIGIDGDGSSNPWNGFIDDVKVYPYLRTESEIQTDFNQNSTDAGSPIALGTNDESFTTEGLVGYWKMDENTGTEANDTSGNGNAATLGSGGSAPTWTVGKFASGLNFDGTDDTLTVTDPPTGELDFNNQDFTISAWVYPEEANVRIAKKRANGTDEGFAFARVSGNWDFTLEELTSGDWCVTQYADSTLDEWMLITATYDADRGECKIYKNGELGDTNTASSNPANLNISNSEDISFGRDSGIHSDVRLDEIRIYNRALSSNEALDLYKWAPGPVAYYDFEEASGTTTYDKSGNSNDGSLSGGMNDNSWIRGKYGRALEFNSTGNIVDFGDVHDSVFEGAYTLSMWIKNNETGYSRITGKGQSLINILMNYPSNGQVRYYTGSTLDANSLASNASDLNNEQWHYLTFIRDGTNQFIYVDGVYDNERVESTAPTANNRYFQLGHDDNGIGQFQYFGGFIDDVRLYNYVRTNEQIVQDMNAGHPAPGSPIGSALLHYKFDEGYGDTAYDSGTGDNDGDLGGSGQSCPADVNTSCPSWINDGKFGKGLNFSRAGTTDDYINITDTSELSFGDTSNDQPFSISTWVNFADAGLTAIFSKGSTGAREYSLDTNASDKLQFTLFDNTSSVWRAIITSSTFTADEGSWIHLAGTYDGSSSVAGLKLYKNGELLNTDSSTNGAYVAMHDQAQSATIGRKFNDGTTYASGDIDELKIYNFELSSAQVGAEYNQGKSVVFGAASTTAGGSAPSYSADRSYCPPGDPTSTCSTPIGEWLLNENTGVNAYDTSENGNTGTLTNSPVWKHIGACKHGSCLEFDGSDQFVDIGAGPSSVNSIEMWVYPETTTEYLLNITSTTDYLWINGNTVTATNFTSPTIYVDGIETTYITADEWHHVALTTSTTESASNFDIARTADTNYLQGKIDSVVLYDYVRTPAQIAWSYNKGGPIGWWKFDECTGTTVYDSSGRDNHGTIYPVTNGNTAAGNCDSGISTEMWDDGTTGKYGASLGFDNDDDYVEIPHSDAYNVDSITVSAWIKSTGGGIQQVINRDNTTTFRSFQFRLDGGYVDFIPFISAADTDNTGTTLVNDNTWHHIAATYDDVSGHLNIYVDGKQDYFEVESGNPIEDEANLVLEIGVHANTFYNFNGQIDDAMIFNYAMTPEQIKNYYNKGAIYFK